MQLIALPDKLEQQTPIRIHWLQFCITNSPSIGAIMQIDDRLQTYTLNEQSNLYPYIGMHHHFQSDIDPMPIPHRGEHLRKNYSTSGKHRRRLTCENAYECKW